MLTPTFSLMFGVLVARGMANAVAHSKAFSPAMPDQRAAVFAGSPDTRRLSPRLFSVSGNRLASSLRLSLRSHPPAADIWLSSPLANQLTRISHQLSAAAREKAASTSLRSLTVLNILSSMLPRAELRAPCIHGLLPRLATKPGEKCG